MLTLHLHITVTLKWVKTGDQVFARNGGACAVLKEKKREFRKIHAFIYT